MKTYVAGLALHVFNLVIYMDVDDQIHVSAALSQGNFPWCSLDRSLGWPHRSSEHGDEEKLLSLTGIEAQYSSPQPVTILAELYGTPGKSDKVFAAFLSAPQNRARH